MACYCEDCQKASGGGPSFNIVISDENIKIKKGVPSIYKVKANSGNSVERLFCSNCGTAICSKLISRTVWKAGLFSHLKDIEVGINVWSSKANKLCNVDSDKKPFDVRCKGTPRSTMHSLLYDHSMTTSKRPCFA